MSTMLRDESLGRLYAINVGTFYSIDIYLYPTTLPRVITNLHTGKTTSIRRIAAWKLAFSVVLGKKTWGIEPKQLFIW